MNMKDGITILKQNQEPTVHSFVITDIEGRKKYATVLNYYREFYCCQSVSIWNTNLLKPLKLFDCFLRIVMRTSSWYK